MRAVGLPAQVLGPRRGNPARWLWAVIVGQIVCQLLLLTPALSALRVLFRTASFSLSLLALVFVRVPGAKHPALRWLLGGMAILVLELLHPDTDSLEAGVSVLVLQIAICGALLWASRLEFQPALLEKVVLVLWAFHFASAAVGILQVIYPGSFQPELSSTLDEGYLRSLEFALPSGVMVLRPMGLTDTPGGAATAGYYAVLLGMGMFWSRRGVMRGLAVASIATGIVAVYLSHVRVALVCLGICLVALAVVLVLAGVWSRVAVLIATVSVLGLSGLTWAVSLGGNSVSDRVESLMSDEPGEVYYDNRGHFLEYTFETLVPEYPLGAGLGRWGPLSAYFARHPEDRLWAEIQWTGWILDGGILLLLVMLGAVISAVWTTFRIALLPTALLGESLVVWAGIVFAYDIGTLATTFSYPVFVSQSGLEFWMLNGLVFSQAVRRPAPAMDVTT